MGGGGYSVDARAVRAVDLGYTTKSAGEIFTSRSINNAMDPRGATLRESCDSDEHPDSVAIILALDLTGSMGSIPHHLVKEGLPKIMGSIIQKGVKHPQMLFLGIGDHECDMSPLQVGQFESSDELLDKWLTDIYLEGGGGGNAGESYLLAWYFAANHTSIDCFKKRKQKGFLFTIGDEPCLPDLPGSVIKSLMGVSQASDTTSLELLDKARELYNVHHLHVMEGSNGRDDRTMNGWKQLMGDNLILVKNHRDIPSIIADIITKGASKSVSTETQNSSEKTKKVVQPKADDKEEMML
jgi:hypothetical protein